MSYSTFSERILNGMPLNWNRWGSLQNITPAQAAKLAYRIDPITWSNNQFHKIGTAIPKDLQEKIDRLTQTLSNQKNDWSLEHLAKELKDEAPEGMLYFLSTTQSPQNTPNTLTTQAASTKQKSRECQLHPFIMRAYAAILKKKGKATAKEVWMEIVRNHSEYDIEEIIDEIDGDNIYWRSHYGNAKTFKRSSFDSLLSRLKS